jgi:hypothetical protein
MKSPLKLLAALSFAAILTMGFSRSLKADAWDKKTVLTISEPIQVPNLVLAPGTYVFKLADFNYRHVVKIYNENETKLLTTALAVPNERVRSRDRSEFDFWETRAGQPRAMRAWFYPNEYSGQAFVYDSETASQILGYKAPVERFMASAR